MFKKLIWMLKQIHWGLFIKQKSYLYWSAQGRDKRILEIGTDNQIPFELLLSLPTYRVYQIDKLK